MEMSGSRFRCIRCDRITESMMLDNSRNPDLFELTQPAKFSEVDAFFSHSWSDDAAGKWAALQRWALFQGPL